MAETVQMPTYAYGLGLLAFPLGLFVYSKMFPSHAKKINRKITAWMCSKVMRRVHAKCIPQKKTLFQSFDLLNVSKPLEVLEIGVGPGSNLDFLPAGCNLSCLEPNLENQPYVEQALKDYPDVHFSRFVKGFAEDMREFDDNTIDAVILTFTLCSVRHPQKALSEIKRVLKPGGLFFFMEHVAAPRNSGHRRVQETLDWVWPVVVDGCHLARESWSFVEQTGFTSVKLEHFRIKMLPFLSYGLYGYGVK